MYAIAQAGGTITTSNLRKELERVLHPTDEDLVILKGRKDVSFSQKVRNLKSHSTLLKKGLATHTENGFEITADGRRLVNLNRHKLETLFQYASKDIAYELSQLSQPEGDNKEYLDDRIVTEGELRTRTVEYRTRSRELRDAAFDHYSHNGIIECRACDFDFAQAYPEIGVGTIQLHHLKPISYMRGEQIPMHEAILNICPLCANCHQIVHKKDPCIPIDDLKAILQVQYDYQVRT